MDKCVLCDNKYKYKCPKCLSKLCSLSCTKSHFCSNEENNKDTKNKQQELENSVTAAHSSLIQQQNNLAAGDLPLEMQQKYSAASEENNKTDVTPVSNDNQDLEIKKILKECKLLDKISGRLESTARFILNPILFNTNSYRCKKQVKKTCNNKKININYSPIIFKRNKLNKNFIKNNIIYWTVEWVFLELNISIISQRVSEKEKLVEAYENLLKTRKASVPNNFRDSSGICILLRRTPGMKNENEFYKCNLEDTVVENLTNTSIVDMEMNKNKNRLILETLMGDPVLSFFVNSRGVSIGTALGRVSSYIFTEHKYSNTNNKDTTSSLDNKDNKNTNNNKVMKTLNESHVPNEFNSVGGYHLDLESNFFDNKSDGKNTKDNKKNNNTNNKDTSSSMELSGKYYVFASYSDEPVNALYIQDNHLVSLVGLNAINVYNIQDYTIEKQMAVSYMLNISGANMYNKYSNYKQIVQSNEKVLMFCNKFVLLVDLSKVLEQDDNNNNTNSSNNSNSNTGSSKNTNSSRDTKNNKKNNNKDTTSNQEEVNKDNNNIDSLSDKYSKLSLSYCSSRIYTKLNVSNNLLNSNVLNFEYPNIVTVQYSYSDNNNKDSTKVISLYEIENNSAVLVNSIEIADKKYNLVNQCKLWNSSVVVVLDFVNILLYSNTKDDTYNKDTSSNQEEAKNSYRFDVNGKFELEFSQKMKADVLSLNCSLNNRLLLLNKKSKIKVLNKQLTTLYTYDLYKSTFELGWSYNLLSYKDHLVYNSDEGVFMLKLPNTLD